MSFLGTSGLLRGRSTRSDRQSRSPSVSPGDLLNRELLGPSSPAQHTVPGAFRATRLECRMPSADDDISDAVGRTLEQPIDLHLLDYVSEYDSNLMCPICRCPFVDPVALSECEHCFCRDCLRQTWQQQTYTPGIPKGRCPTCRAACLLPTRSSIPKIVINILDDLLVKCPKYEEGCQIQVKRGEVQEHVGKYCGHTLVPCPSETCELAQKRKDGEICLHHGVSCIDCRETITVAELEAHWKTHCSDRKVDCELCRESVYYRELSAHMKDTCKDATIPCTGSLYGCSHQSKRGEIDEHIGTCTFAALGPFFETQMSRTKALEEQQTRMTRRIQILEGGFNSMETILAKPIDASASDAPPSTSPLGDHHPSTPMTEPASDPLSGPGFTSPYTHLLSLHESLRDELSRVSAALSDLDARHSMLILNENLRLKEDLAFIAGQMGGLGRQVGWLTSARLQEAEGAARGLAQGPAVGGRGRTKL